MKGKIFSDFFAQRDNDRYCGKPEHLESKEYIHCKIPDVSGEEEKGYKNEAEDYAYHFEQSRRKGGLSYDSAAVEKIRKSEKASVINSGGRCAFAFFGEFGAFLLIFGGKKVKLAFGISEKTAEFLSCDV